MTEKISCECDSSWTKKEISTKRYTNISYSQVTNLSSFEGHHRHHHHLWISSAPITVWTVNIGALHESNRTLKTEGLKSLNIKSSSVVSWSRSSTSQKTLSKNTLNDFDLLSLVLLLLAKWGQKINGQGHDHIRCGQNHGGIHDSTPLSSIVLLMLLSCNWRKHLCACI